MKKLIFSAIALVAFSTGAFANDIDVNQTSNDSNQKEVSITLLRARSGSYTFTDSCGDVYDVSWTCTGECSDSSIATALTNWEIQNTCGPNVGGTTNWQSTTP